MKIADEPRLIFQEEQGLNEFQVINGHYPTRNDVPEFFQQTHADKMIKYKNLKKQMKELQIECKALLHTLKVEFKEEVKQNCPELFL